MKNGIAVMCFGILNQSVHRIITVHACNIVVFVGVYGICTRFA